LIKKRRVRAHGRKNSLESFEESVKHKINQDILSKVPNFPKIKSSLPVMRKENITILCALVLILAFILMQLFLMNSTGIGTDEGNFVFVAKEVMQGKEPYIDFYTREAGSLIFLLPVLNIFGPSIENLRWVILVVHVLEIGLIAFLAFKLTKSKKITIFSIVLSIALLQINGPLDFYQGSFYQFSNIFSLAIIAITTLKCFGYLDMSWRKTAIITGLLIGIDIICYKGATVLLAIVPFLILLGANHKGKTDFTTSNILIFFVAALLPVWAYLVYFSFKTNILHIIQMILWNVLACWFVALIFFLVVFKFFRDKKIVLKADLVVFGLNILFLLGIIYRMFLGYTETVASLYGGLVFINLFTLMTIQLFSIYFSGRFRKVIFFINIILNIFILVFGFGNRGFFSGPPFWYYLASAVIFIIYNFVLFCVYLEEREKSGHDNKIFILGAAVYLILMLFSIGGKLLPTKYESVLILLPVLILLIIKLKSKVTTLIRVIFIITVLSTIFINSTLSNDFTLYQKSSFDSAVGYMQTSLNPTEKVFSLDTALLAEIQNESFISFYSQHIFIQDEDTDYFYNGLAEDYAGFDITLKKDDLIEKLMNTPPKYVVGSNRATLRVITENNFINSWFNESYFMKADFGRILIYERR